MNNDPKRYDDLYEEDTEYEDGYDTNDYDYIVDDEDEDENALWDDEEASADTDDDSDEPPRKKRRKRKETVYADVDTDEAETEEYETVRRRLAKEQRLIDEVEADAADNPIEDDDTGEEQPERKLLKRELRAQALKRLEDSARTLRLRKSCCLVRYAGCQPSAQGALSRTVPKR